MIRRLAFSMVLLCLCLLAAPVPALAKDPFTSVDCSGAAKTSAVCSDKTTSDPLTGSNGAIIKVTVILAKIAGAAAIIVILIGGLKYITASGDSNNVRAAKNTIEYALLGLVVIVMAQALITFVVSRL